MSSDVEIPNQSSGRKPKLTTLSPIEDSRPPAIKALNPKQLQTVNEMLQRGETAWTIAKKIHKDWGIHNHKSIQAVQGQVETYRKKYRILEVTETTETSSDGTEEKKVEVKTSFMASSYLKGRLDAYTLNEQMVQLQLKRINKIMEREEKMPTLLDQTRKELELLTKMMAGFTSLQFELGILQRTAHVLEHHHSLNNPDLLSEESRVANKLKAIQGRDTILSRVRNVLALASKFDEDSREIIEAEVVEMERGE
jgi:hypothetical protein